MTALGEAVRRDGGPMGATGGIWRPGVKRDSFRIDGAGVDERGEFLGVEGHEEETIILSTQMVLRSI